MKIYNRPEIELVRLNCGDVIAVSPFKSPFIDKEGKMDPANENTTFGVSSVEWDKPEF